MIYLPPPQPVLNRDIRVSGDVEIHPTASLAPGVILQAAPDCRIVIGADVCIGMGVIINASYDSVEIESGAILGSGVLVIGKCKIGGNACIGTAVTIFQANVEAMEVIEPGSVLGDSSRKVSKNDRSGEKQVDNSSSTPKVNKSSWSKVSKNGFYSPKSSVDEVKTQDINQESINQKNTHKKSNTSPTPTQDKTVGTGVKAGKDPVVGQVYINQLLVTLFPNNQDFNSKTRKLE